MQLFGSFEYRAHRKLAERSFEREHIPHTYHSPSHSSIYNRPPLPARSVYKPISSIRPYESIAPLRSNERYLKTLQPFNLSNSVISSQRKASPLRPSLQHMPDRPLINSRTYSNFPMYSYSTVRLYFTIKNPY